MADNIFGKQIDWDAASRFGAGAVDELLYGLPEFVAKKIDRKAVEDWIAKNPQAYKTGETVGTVGSIFMPVPGGRAIKSADTLADILKLAGRGALTGAGEAGVRGVTSEKPIDQILKDIQAGATFGGIGGAAGGLISKAIPRVATEAAKTTEKAYLGTTDLGRRQALAYLNDIAGPGAKGIGKLKVAEKGRKELVRVGREIGAHIPGKAEPNIMKYSALWDKLDDATEAIMPNVRGSEMYAAATKSLNLPELYKEFGEDTVNAFLKQTMKEGASRSGLANIRQFLQDIVDASYSKGNIKTGRDAALQRMQRSIAQKLRTGVDEIVMDTAEKAGINVDFRKLKRDYLPMRAIAQAMAIDEITPARINLGSQTAEKLAGQELMRNLGTMGGGAALGGMTGAAVGGETTEDKIKNALLGAATGALASKGIAKGMTMGLATAQPVMSKIAEKVGDIAPEAMAKYGAAAGGQAASIIARSAVKEAAPETPKEESAAQAGATAGSGDTPAYISQVMDRMKMYAQIKGVKVDSPEFAQFAQQVYSVTNGFAPDKVAGILYPDEGERTAYLKALSAAQRLSETLPGALADKPGFLQSESEEETLSRTSAIDQLGALVGDVAKESGTEKEAKAQLNKILASRESPERKTQLIKYLLAQYGVDVDKLAAMGVA